jgi:hypothetical protein
MITVVKKTQGTPSAGPGEKFDEIVLDPISSFSINIDIQQKHDFGPKSESIKKFIDYEISRVLEESRAAERDLELISFRPKSNFILRPHFNNQASYSNVGFTDFYLTGTSVFTQESFYIFDLFDKFEENNQTLLSRNFIKMSKIVKDTTTDVIFDVSKKIVKEFVNIYVPSYFIKQGVDTFYLKVFFFNALDGSFRFFQCSTTDEKSSKNYLNVKIDNNDKTYSIIGGDTISTNPNVYKITQIIEPKREEEEANKNKIKKTKPSVKLNKTITAKGKFI